MNDQEREVIADIFRRLEQVANQPRDPEAEAFIADHVRRQPYAPYAMAQAIFVQEQALTNLKAENDALRGELEAARRQPQQGGFLSGLFGGGARPAEPEIQPPRGASPWGQPQSSPPPSYGAPQGGMMGGAGPMMGGAGPWGGMQRGGGGFLQGALSTAAGVAGGMMLANALSHAFGGLGETAQGALGDKAAGLAGFGEPKGNETQAGDQSLAGISDGLYPDPQDASAEEEDRNDWDMGGDSGDDGDWI